MKNFFSLPYLQAQKRGFTLIELVVVIGVFAILASLVIAILNPGTQFSKSRDARRKSDIASVTQALESYYHDNGSYPISNNTTGQIMAPTAIAWGTAWQPYMNNLPKDPVATKRYVYYSDGQSYFVYASLDKATDPQSCNGGNACASLSVNGISNTLCGGTCNYGVASSDKVL